MRAEFKEGLKKSQDAMKQPKAPLPPVFSGFEDPDNVPWKRALSKEKQLNLEDKWSSVSMLYFIGGCPVPNLELSRDL